MQKSCAGPDLAEVRRLFSYDPETGIFTRLVRSGKAFPGTPPGTKRPDGYWAISVGNRQWLAHRLAVQYVTGEYPRDEIDHINGDKADNRYANLREVDHHTNLQNRRTAKPNKRASEYLGVHRNPNGQRWVARIRHLRETIYIGTYDTPEEAHDAYVAKKRELHAGCTL